MSRFKQIKQWQDKKCPKCEFFLSCPRTIQNIEVCLEEEKQSDDSLDGLVRKTLRKIVIEERRQRREQQQEERAEKYKERDKKARLYCANLDEYNKWHPSKFQ